MSLESLFLDKTLEAHVALVGPYVGVDEDVALHVGQQGELTTADATLVLLHPLKSERRWRWRVEKCGRRMDASNNSLTFVLSSVFCTYIFIFTWSKV